MQKIICKTVSGSHLFGLNTPFSDQDFKGIFQENWANILLKKDQEHFVHSTNQTKKRNTSLDKDVEYKELRRFIWDCLGGQAYALEMLFCPQNLVLETSLSWHFIQENQQKLVTQNLEPFVSYANSMAQKYSLRGARLKELERVYRWFEQQPQHSKLSEVVDTLPLSENTFRQIYTHEQTGQTEERLSVLGIILQGNKLIMNCLPTLQKRLDQYGERSKTNRENGGVDWKAYSHAFRLLYELEELLTTRKLSFPSKNRDFLLQIKLGNIPLEQIQEQMFLELERIKQIPNTLSAPDQTFWEKWILEVYGRKD